MSFSLRNIWNHGDEEYAPDDTEAQDAAEENSSSFQTGNYASAPSPLTSYGGGSSNARPHSHRLRSVAPAMRTREKNIYTLKPKSQDEATIAADYLKTGSAVVVNLDAVDRTVAVRIVDFMSGVCYGLEVQGHAMKLGETIFLFTPGDFEISSDETDYGENREFIFRDLSAAAAAAMADNNAPAGETPAATAGSYQAAYNSPAERRSWER